MSSSVLDFEVECPYCHINIHILFWRELEAKAIEKFDMNEVTAQQERDSMWLWFHNASLMRHCLS
ncbi:hypothetical protein LCGC14_1128270 [marine sediment metagenome]|uniref:Uncharacterized protein n=1 Tax=marine sediment metagenome TaxID=412755 RepID=A0A0F9Q7P6_9ZZZZ